MNILIATFNNYYNRVYRKLDTISEYIANTSTYAVLQDINFNPGDGVTTKQIIGKGEGVTLNWEQGGPDYLVVFEGSGDGTTGNKIQSRWFILDEDRTRLGQYELTLKRDVLADMLTSSVAASMPVQISKAIISDPTSPFLFNSENVTVNQVKSSNEILLKDETTMPWLVLYLKKGILGSGDQLNKVTIQPEFEIADVTIAVPIEQWSYYQYSQTDALYTDVYRFTSSYESNQMIGEVNGTPRYLYLSYIYSVDKSNNLIGSEVAAKYVNGATNLMEPRNGLNKTSLDYSFSQRTSNMISQSRQAYGIISNSDYNALTSYNGKIIKDSNNKYWQVNFVVTTTETNKKFTVSSSTQANLWDNFRTAWNSGTGQSVTPNNNAFTVVTDLVHYRLIFTELPDQEITIDLGACSQTTDNPLFDAICMPYGKIHYTNPGEYLYGYDTSAVRAMQIMNAIATQLTADAQGNNSGKTMDLQILPYCPIRFPVGSSGDFSDVGAYIWDGQTDLTMYISDRNKLGMAAGKDIVYVAKTTNTTFNISASLDSSIFNYADSITAPAKKVKYVNDCTMVRLCSPNYAGVFEFNLAKNGMYVDLFNVDMTLRPYNPYIHVNPNFNVLYGSDTNDQRGLICGGDFSLGCLNSSWAQYELQNRNYQALFDRQIQNLDVMHGIQKMEAGFQAVSGTIQGAATGAAMGAQSGNAYVAAAGAVIGGATSAVGGVLDMANLNKRQTEEKSYLQDNYALRLGNVRALPNTITRTSALTYNNKLFPFIEIYECTEAEKEAYINKITYDGMTVGAIGKITDYNSLEDPQGNYIQAKIVRYPFNADKSFNTHEVNELNNELMKGVYI